MQSQDLASTEEVNIFLQKHFENKNNAGVSNFLGLSPSQKQRMLHTPFQEGHFVQIDKRESMIFEKVQLIEQAYFLMGKIRDVAEDKLTEKGNLPRSLVKEFWSVFYKKDKYSFEPNREEDCSQITRLKCLLGYSGFIQKKAIKCVFQKKEKIYLS